MSLKTHNNCFICNGKTFKSLKGYEVHSLVKCNSCGFVFINRIPSEEDLYEHYKEYAYGEENYFSPITIKKYNLLLDEFEKYRKTNKILDVGCGVGFFLSVAKERGWDVYGTEYSETAMKICTEKGIKMSEGILNLSNYEIEEFDVITSFEVLEHINNQNEEVNKFYHLLRKGGLFYCTTPNFNGLLRYYLKAKYNVIGYPEHLAYFTKRTLNFLFKKHNFTNIKFLSTGISLTRLKTSRGISNEKYVAETSADEMLRKKMEKNFFLSIVKSLIDFLFTLFNVGSTLKGYYLKK